MKKTKRTDKAFRDLWADIGSKEYWASILEKWAKNQVPLRDLIPFKDRWPQPGYIGRNYFSLSKRIVIMGQNPSANDPGENYAPDQELFELIRNHSRERSVTSLKALFDMQGKVMRGEGYRWAWRPIRIHVFGDLELDLEDIAYLNYCPLSTRGNKTNWSIFNRAYKHSTELQLERLSPDKIVVLGKGAHEEFIRNRSNEWPTCYIPRRGNRDVEVAYARKFLGQY